MKLSEMTAWIRGLSKIVQPPLVIGLDGSLGAGKTTFVQKFVASLGDVQEVVSPTYSLIHHYEVDNHSVFHIDLYRLKNEDDLESTGFWDLFADKTSIILIEWMNRLDESSIPSSWKLWRVSLDQVSGKEDCRRVSFTGSL